LFFLALFFCFSDNNGDDNDADNESSVIFPRVWFAMDGSDSNGDANNDEDASISFILPQVRITTLGDEDDDNDNDDADNGDGDNTVRDDTILPQSMVVMPCNGVVNGGGGCGGDDNDGGAIFFLFRRQSLII